MLSSLRKDNSESYTSFIIEMKPAESAFSTASIAPDCSFSPFLDIVKVRTYIISPFDVL